MSNNVLMENYLLVLKSTIEVYIHGTLESSNKDIRKLLKSGLTDTLDSQDKCYTKMVENGWYQVNNIEASEIKKTYNSVKN